MAVRKKKVEEEIQKNEETELNSYPTEGVTFTEQSVDNKVKAPYVDYNLKIEIRPIPNRAEIRDFSEDLEYFSGSNTITAYPNPLSLRFESGLGIEDIEYLRSQNFPYPFEDVQYTPREAHPFWESNLVKMELRPTPQFLYPGKNLFDFIKWKYLLVSQFVYKNEEEMKTGSKSEATHYIYDERVENSLKASKIERRNNLINRLKTVSLAKKRDLVLIILNEDMDNKDENYITLKLDEIISDNIKSNELESLINEDTDLVSLKATIKSAIMKNIIKKTHKGFYYFDLNLGFTEDDVVKNLKSVDNQQLLLNITEKIK